MNEVGGERAGDTGEHEGDDAEHEDNFLSMPVPVITNAVKQLFIEHVSNLEKGRISKREKLRMRTVVDSTALVLGTGNNEGAAGNELVATEHQLQGDINFQNVQDYLKLIDERGYERSDHQLKFHNAFLRATARVMYKKDWSRRESEIKKMHGWEKTPSEVLISTPRRFGKTFSCAPASAFMLAN